MVSSPRKSNAATKGGRKSPSKTAPKHKAAKAVLKRTHTIAEAAKEGKAFVRSQNRKTAPGKRRQRVKRPAPVKVAPAKPVEVKVSPVKAVAKKGKTPKRHVTSSPKLNRTKTMQETIAAANAFLGKPADPVTTPTVEVKKAKKSPAKKAPAKKAKLTRKSTIQQTIGAAQGFLKKSRRSKK